MSHREAATVEYVKAPERDEDHGVLMCTVGFEFDGMHQAWSSVVLSADLAQAYVGELCRVFDVAKLEDIVGKRCFVLRSFSGWNELIEGVESLGCRRFTNSLWVQRHHPGIFRSPLEHLRISLRHDIERMRRDIARSEERLKTIDADYIDWSAEGRR